MITQSTDLIGKRIKNKKLTDVSIIVKEWNKTEVNNGWGFDQLIELHVVWMNDHYEVEIGPDTIYIQPETLEEWYIYEPVKQTSE